MGAGLISNYKEQECVECNNPALPVYFIHGGPYCYKHWLEALQAYHSELNNDSQEQWGPCTGFNQLGGILFPVVEEGLFSSPHYFSPAREPNRKREKPTNEESDSL